MNGNHIGAIVIVFIVVVGGWFLLTGNKAEAPVTETPVSSQMPVIGSTTPEMIVEDPSPSVTVEYTDQGFSPKNITVSIGTTVTFVNKSSGKMWVASAPHPAHTAYSGTTLGQHCPDDTNSVFDQCTAVTSGNSFSFTFNKSGAWNYHDHINSFRFGQVAVMARQ